MPFCGVLFVADDVVDVLRQWVADTGINIRKLFDKFDENNDGTIDLGRTQAWLAEPQPRRSSTVANRQIRGTNR